MAETKNIMIVGVGGQGTLLTSRILGGITVEAGYDVKLSEVHGMAQRGGSVVTYVRYGEKVAEPIVEEGQADVLIAFERLEALRYAHFLKKDGVIIVNDQRIDPMPVVTGVAKYPDGIIEELSKKYRVVSVDAMDEAGNAAVQSSTSEFVIDKTEPVIEISGIENDSANNDVVMPAVQFSDTNYNEGAATIELSGANHGIVHYDGTFAQTENGQTFSFSDFAHEQDVDDIYTLTARETCRK